jgi:hypothetical protein
VKYELSRIGTITEIATELGLTYGRAAQLCVLESFPEPIWTFGIKNRVWDLDAVQRWDMARRNVSETRRKQQIKMMLEALNEELKELEE